MEIPGYAAVANLNRTFRTPESLASYRKAASDCKSAIYSFISSYENNLISNGNLGAFCRYANKKLCTKSAIEPLSRRDGALTCDPTEKAQLLENALVKNYTADNGLPPCMDYIRF
jgi:hypothetical protein